MTPPNDLMANLMRLAEEHDIAALGVADAEALARDIPGLFGSLPRAFPRAVVIGLRLIDAVLDDIGDRPTPLYFHMYRQANFALDRAAFAVATLLQNNGYEALPVAASQTITRHPMKGHISHKLLGRAAGIGWIGRQSLLVHPTFGSRMRYASILTDAALEPGKPIEQDCGACRQCIDACPVNAIHETHGEFDLDACYARLCMHSRIQGISQHVCGVCVKACGGKGWRQRSST